MSDNGHVTKSTYEHYQKGVGSFVLYIIENGEAGGKTGSSDLTRLRCRPGMDGNEGVGPVQPGPSNSPPDCCI